MRGGHHNGASRTKKLVYTCPSCRAVVRETRPNAQVTTLLEMFLVANPGRGRSEAERKEMARAYTHGEGVLPKEREEREERGNRRRGGEDDGAEEEEEDRRLLEEVREMSLGEIAAVDGGGGRDLWNERRRRDERVRRPVDGRGGAGRRDQPTQDGQTANARQNPAQANRAVNLGHQSSLRSLLIPYNSAEMKEDIMRQIVEEGLLDDIDWENIEAEQEDEISERIADAYRRRRRNRSRRRSGDFWRPRDASVEVERTAQAGETRQTISAQQQTTRPPDNSNAQPRAGNTRPPASRPHLLDAVDSHSRPRQHRRSSSQGRDRGLRAENTSYSSHAAARSATDLSERPRSRNARDEAPRRASHESRRSTDPEGASISERWRRAAATPSVNESAGPVTLHGREPNARAKTPPATRDTATGQTEHRSKAGQQHLQQHPTQPPPPSIVVSCDRCGRSNIEKSLHYSCHLCRPAPETFDLCLRCYRLGRGCLHWYGFGHTVWPRFERLAAPGSEPPHVLRSQKYILPSQDGSEAAARERDSDRQVPGDGEMTLQTGVFCDICHTNANDCYWHCSHCNEGEWGFCHRCVNSAHHCTHPLLPLSLHPPPAPMTDSLQLPHQQQPEGPTSPTPQNELTTLSLPTTCNACTSLIPPTHTRLHCPTCSDGDYDICLPCYRTWSQTGRIAPHDGLHGWRRCLAGHRMLLVDFEIKEGGLAWRRVVEGVVGGWSLNDFASASVAAAASATRNQGHGREGESEQQTTSRKTGWSWRATPTGPVQFKFDHRRQFSLDPNQSHHSNQESNATTTLAHDKAAKANRATSSNDGKALALWSWIPAEGVTDELAFPRGAVLEEVVDVNGDFGWGVYARGAGLFPCAYVRPLG